MFYNLETPRNTGSKLTNDDSVRNLWWPYGSGPPKFIRGHQILDCKWPPGPPSNVNYVTFFINNVLWATTACRQISHLFQETYPRPRTGAKYEHVSTSTLRHCKYKYQHMCQGSSTSTLQKCKYKYNYKYFCHVCLCIKVYSCNNWKKTLCKNNSNSK